MDSKTPPDTAERPVKLRMRPEQRRALIISESIGYFAEHGFKVDTRSLARHLRITQALLYKYFPSKQLLLEAVFEKVFRKQSAANWISLLRDRNTSLRLRLVRFFTDYANTTYDYDWIRIYTQAAFSGGELNKRYIASVTRPLLQTIAEEVRLAHGLSLAQAAQVSELEIEVLWQFHFGIYYHPYRTHVYGLPPSLPIEAIIDASVDGLLASLKRCIDEA
jgi:AcrR family transcriptional regulator